MFRFFIELAGCHWPLFLSLSFFSISRNSSPHRVIRTLRQQPPNTESWFAVYDERFGAISLQKASIGTKCSRSRARHRTQRRRFSPPPLPPPPPPSPPGTYISFSFRRYSTNYNLKFLIFIKLLLLGAEIEIDVSVLRLWLLILWFLGACIW